MEAPITPPPQINTCMHLLSSAPGPHLLPTNRDARSIAADGDSDFQCRLTRIGRLKGDDKIGDGHRWDLFPKVSLAPDSLLKQRGFELVVLSGRKRPEGGLKLGAVETVRRHNRVVRFWSDSQTHQVVLRVAQPACRARREHLQQRVFGIGRDL